MSSTYLGKFHSRLTVKLAVLNRTKKSVEDLIHHLTYLNSLTITEVDQSKHREFLAEEDVFLGETVAALLKITKACEKEIPRTAHTLIELEDIIRRESRKN